MEKFAFIIHPLEAKADVSRKYPFVKYLPERVVEWGLKYKSPMAVSHITGLKSAAGPEAEGWFVGCPLTARQMLTLPVDIVLDKIIKAARVAQDLGAGIVGLGAFTSVVGDGGITVAKNVDIGVTTGNSYTVATAVEGALKAAELMEIDPLQAKAAVVGAGGSIGRTCARILARRVPEISLIGLEVEPLEKVAAEIAGESKAVTHITTDVSGGLRDAEIIVAVTSAVGAVIYPEHLKPGAVVCDVARPRDVSKRVAKERDDVLVIEGGVVEVPGEVEFNFNFGFPPRTAYACMSETMILALEGTYESFTLGKEVSIEQVDRISALAEKHGFKLAGFRSFEKALTTEEIERTRERARSKRVARAV